MPLEDEEIDDLGDDAPADGPAQAEDEDEGDPPATEEEPEGPSLPDDPEEAQATFRELLAARQAAEERATNLDRARAEARKENRNLRQRTDQILALMERMMASEEGPKDGLPNQDEDLVGHLKGSFEKSLENRLRPIEERLSNQAQQAEQAAVDTYVVEARGGFEATYPDYPIDDAVQHLMAVNYQATVADLGLRYPNADPYEIEAAALDHVSKQRDVVVHRMRQAGRNVFEEVRKAAEARGFAPSNGRKPNKMERLREDVRSSSPTAARRVPQPASPSKLVTAKRLAEMPDEEFSHYLGNAAKQLGVSEDELFQQIARKSASR